MTRKYSPLTIFFLVCFFTAVPAVSFENDNLLKSRIDSIVHQYTMQVFDSNMTGMSLGICHNGEMHFYNYGSIEKGKQILPAKNTVYEIGSITKTFTGILLAQAVTENKLNLNDDVRKYLGSDFSNLAYKGSPVRVVNLVNHTSGLPEDFIPKEFLELKNPTMFDIVQLFDNDRGEIFLRELAGAKPNTMPGSKIVYSNSGMMTLGIILEKIYSKSYSELIKKYFTDKLNMKHTETVYYKSETDNYTKGYDKKGNIMPHITFQIAGAAGGLKSTAYDMVLFIKENLNGLNEAIKLSHKSSIQIEGQEIGLGWQILKNHTGEKQLWHDGGEPGFSSYITIIPERKTGIIGLTNQRGRQSFLNKLCYKIISDI